MAKQDKHPDPARIRTSRTGRVPQWVMDEALGKTVERVPFRGPTTGGRPPRRTRARRRLRSGAAVVTLTVVCGAVYFVADPIRPPGPSTLLASGDDQAPPPGHEESRHRLRPALPVGVQQEGPTYRFLQHQHGSRTPITWSPCRPIHYVVRPDNAPVGGDAVIAQAVAAIGTATGLQLVDDGTTAEAPSEDRESYQPKRYGKRWAPVLIAWATKTEVPDFGIDYAGEAGPAGVQTPSGDQTHVSGTVYLDPTKLGGADRAAALAVVEHELGHLIGLAHVPDRAQVMYPRAQREVSRYGPGDLAGLAALGRGACQPDA